MLWLYLDFYQLTLDAHLSASTHTDHAPCVVYHKAENRICQCCEQARQYGIEVGMGMAQAASLCSTLDVRPYQADTEIQQLDTIALHLYQVVADIVVHSPAALSLRLDPMLALYQGLAPLWQAIMHTLKRLAVNYRYASAWSIEAARVLAHAGINTLLTEQKHIRHTLAQCSLGHAALEPRQLQALKRVGIHRVADILQLPATELGKRFDNHLITYLYALRGETLARVVLYRPPSVFSRQIEPHYEIDKCEHLLPWVRRLLDEASTYLRLRNKLTAHLILTLYYRDLPAQDVDLRAALPQYKVDEWMQLTTLVIDRLTLPAPVVQLRLRTASLETQEGENQDLFNRRFAYFAQMQLVGRLQARLGNHNLQQPQLGNDHRYEKLSQPNAGDVSGTAPAHCPVFYLPEPVALTDATQVTYGPVRIQAGWWDSDPVARDYFIARNQQGRYLHIFRDEQQRWFIHGWYS